MIKIAITPQFQRMFKKLEPKLQEEAREKISLFTDSTHHQKLKVHKLQGRLKGRYSFSVNYKTRIVYVYEDQTSVVLVAIGSHDVYDV